MVPPVLTCQALLTYSTSYSFPRLAPFCLAKLVVTPGNGGDWSTACLDGYSQVQLSWSRFPQGHVLPKPTGRKVGVSSWQHLQLEVFVVQKGKPNPSSLSGRRHRCGAVLHRQQ